MVPQNADIIDSGRRVRGKNRVGEPKKPRIEKGRKDLPKGGRPGKRGRVSYERGGLNARSPKVAT